MSDRDQIAAHLQYFTELGVSGVSRDSQWTTRERHAVVQYVEDEAVAAEAASVVDMPKIADVPANDTESELEAASGGLVMSLQQIRDVIGNCPRCKLCATRINIVFGVGNPNADLMFVGEAPGADEDEQGEPFVGRAGQLLNKIIEAIGLTRADVYIANVIKCRPPNNRPPEADEIARCEPFLFRQIDSIRPKVVVALGTHAAHTLLKIDTPISKIRGHVSDFRSGAKLVPTFHPAYLLRSPERKRDVWEDMKKVRALLAGDE